MKIGFLGGNLLSRVLGFKNYLTDIFKENGESGSARNCGLSYCRIENNKGISRCIGFSTDIYLDLDATPKVLQQIIGTKVLDD